MAMTHDEFTASAKKFCDKFNERLAATQDRNEIEALRKTFHRHMDEVSRLPAALAEGAMQRLTAVQQEMETVKPVGYVSGFNNGYAIVEPIDRSLLMPVGMALYRSPSKREPLTDKQISSVWKTLCSDDFIVFARAIERAHGIGNES